MKTRLVLLSLVLATTGFAQGGGYALSGGGSGSTAVGDITGLGTGVGTALAVNVGSAGAPVLFNGAGGTPSSFVGTNVSGTAGALVSGHLSSNIKVVSATFDGAGSGLSPGKAKGYFTVPYAGTITGWSISADAGTATLNVWKIAAGTAVPTVSNKITSAGVSLSSGTSVRSTTTSDFSVGTGTAVSAADIIAIDLTTVATATELTFELEITVP